MNTLPSKQLWKLAADKPHPSKTSEDLSGKAFPPMAPSNAKPHPLIPPAAPAAPANETYRTKSIATRLTEAEFAEVEFAAVGAGQKVAEWLREAALAQARSAQEEHTDPILLAEIIGMRALMLNLFAKASEGPLSAEDLRKISSYAEAIKDQKANELLAPRRRRKSPEALEDSP